MHNKIKFGVLIFSIFSLAQCTSDYTEQLKYDIAKDGLVPNEQTACKVAEAIFLPIYGEKIYDERPFHASLKYDSIWVVEGTLEKGYTGGTIYVEIQKKDCKVLKVTHYK